MAVDPLTYVTRWRVRSYELDHNGHVNNAVYLNYAEQLATEHSERAGFGRTWAQAEGGGWVVHHHEITYHRPAAFDDELELTVRVERIRGARAIRHTVITRPADGAAIADIHTEWVWVRRSDGRPALVPSALRRLDPGLEPRPPGRARPGPAPARPLP
ncbi:MAG TPA: acyl-CoA thioesterase [Candidatus Dormibacteraeota bacterium]|nr:acyl-CoA thioesterase [Candidatus Dormibacteraeota bacterium]